MVTAAAPQTRPSGTPGVPRDPATGDHGGQSPPESFQLIIGGRIKLGCYRISTVPLNFVLHRLTMAERPVSRGGGWVVVWEMVGYFATLGGACGRVLQEQIREPVQNDADRLLNLEHGIDAAIKEINSECTTANKFIYTLKYPKKGTKRGTNDPKSAAQ